jgi:thymidine kinase
MTTPNFYAGGILTTFTGCMYSGKTTALFSYLSKAPIAKQKVCLFRPASDTRTLEAETHDEITMTANPLQVGCYGSVFDRIGDATTVGFDEGQFYTPEIIWVCQKLIFEGINVGFAGLNTDFKGEGFGPTPGVMGLAHNTIHLYAVCNVCGEPATMTQRLIGGQPASYYDPVFMLGSEDLYEARCRRCWRVLNHPGY